MMTDAQYGVAAGDDKQSSSATSVERFLYNSNNEKKKKEVSDGITFLGLRLETNAHLAAVDTDSHCILSYVLENNEQQESSIISSEGKVTPPTPPY